MSAETPGNQHNPTATSAEAAKSSPFTPNDIPELSDAERQDPAIKQACDEFCRRFEDFDDPMIVREAIRKADPEITKDELFHDMDRLEAAAREHLPPIVEPNSVDHVIDDKGIESPETRKARLGKFVETHFADICPPEHLNALTGECLLFEDELRIALGDETAQLEPTDASDETLRKKVISAVPEIESNKEIIAEITTDRDREAAIRDETREERDRITAERGALEADHPDIPTDEPGRKAMLTSLTAGNEELRVDKDHAADRNETVTEDLTTIKQVQSRFEQLKTEKGGTVPALRSLLEDGTIKSPEIKAKVENAISTAEALINAIPGKSEVISRLIDQSHVDLAGASPVQIFAGFLAEADKSDELSDEERETLRRIVGQSEADFKTGSDAQRIAQTKEQIIDSETGEVIGEKYVHDSPESMAELRPNLGTYMDGERMMLATKDGLVSKDVTGWTAEDIGMLAEVMDFHRFAEEKGITGFVESIGNVHLDAISNTAFDRRKLIQTRQVISALVGMGEGYDGDVFNPDEKTLLLTNMMRTLTDDDQAIGWYNDQEGTTAILHDLGLRSQNGDPNLDVIRAFGAYMQTNLTGKVTKQDVQIHLYALFPGLVAPVDGEMAKEAA